MTEQSKIVFAALNMIYNIQEQFYWTDSAIVYSWVLNGKKKVEKYVTNRLAKIRAVINDVKSLKLVPSKLNPADIATRGLSPKELVESKLWFFGPEFLLQNEESWPNLNVGDKFGDYDANVTRSDVESLNSVELVTSSKAVIGWKIGTLPLIIDVNRFSSLMKLFRVTVHVLRFKKRLINSWRARKSMKTRSSTKKQLVEIPNPVYEVVTANEMEDVKLIWICGIQHEYLVGDEKFRQLKKQLKLFLRRSRIMALRREDKIR